MDLEIEPNKIICVQTRENDIRKESEDRKMLIIKIKIGLLIKAILVIKNANNIQI